MEAGFELAASYSTAWEHSENIMQINQFQRYDQSQVAQAESMRTGIFHFTTLKYNKQRRYMKLCRCPIKTLLINPVSRAHEATNTM